MTADPRITIPLDDAGRPDLQALIERAGRRHAASIGEEYVEDPFKRPPHQGGYRHINLEAALFAPVELLLVEDENREGVTGTCHLL